MEKFKEAERSVIQKATSFMAGKPIWVYWLVYTLASAVCFGVTYLLLFLLSLNWWILTIIVLVTGMGLGTYSFMKDSKGDGPHQE